MPDPTPPISQSQRAIPTLEELIPIMGEANARECLEAPFSEAQRQRIAAIVANAPRRASLSARRGGDAR